MFVRSRRDRGLLRQATQSEVRDTILPGRADNNCNSCTGNPTRTAQPRTAHL